MHYFRMELDRVKTSALIFHGCYRTNRRACRYFESCGRLCYIVCVAHPGYGFFGYVPEKSSAFVDVHFGMSVFTGGRALYFAAQTVGHELRSVAYAKCRHSQFKKPFVIGKRRFAVYAVGASCENDALRLFCLYLFDAQSIGMYLRVHIAFPYPSRDQLIVLSSEIEDQYGFVLHCRSFRLCCNQKSGRA